MHCNVSESQSFRNDQVMHGNLHQGVNFTELTQNCCGC